MPTTEQIGSVIIPEVSISDTRQNGPSHKLGAHFHNLIGGSQEITTKVSQPSRVPRTQELTSFSLSLPRMFVVSSKRCTTNLDLMDSPHKERDLIGQDVDLDLLSLFPQMGARIMEGLGRKEAQEG